MAHGIMGCLAVSEHANVARTQELKEVHTKSCCMNETMWYGDWSPRKPLSLWLCHQDTAWQLRTNWERVERQAWFLPEGTCGSLNEVRREIVSLQNIVRFWGIPPRRSCNSNPVLQQWVCRSISFPLVYMSCLCQSSVSGWLGTPYSESSVDIHPFSRSLCHRLITPIANSSPHPKSLKL